MIVENLLVESVGNESNKARGQCRKNADMNERMNRQKLESVVRGWDIARLTELGNSAVDPGDRGY